MLHNIERAVAYLSQLARLQSKPLDALNAREALAASAEFDTFGKQLDFVVRRLDLPKISWRRIPNPDDLPVLFHTHDQQLFLISGKDALGNWVLLELDEENKHWQETKVAKLPDGRSAKVNFTKAFRRKDSQVYALIQNEFFGQKTVLLEVLLGSILINLIGLVTAFYTMQVYDRVVPTGALETLRVLTIGVAIAVLFDLIVKEARLALSNRLTDVVDQRPARATYTRFLNLRLDQLPSSVGSLAGQMRGYETVRAFFSSATINIYVDLPFALIFLWLIFMIVGPIGLVPVAFFIVCLSVGYYYFRRADKLAEDINVAANLKTGLLVETVEGAETIKSGQGGWRMLAKWMATTDTARVHEIDLREVGERAKHVIAALQQAAYLSLIALGAMAASRGELTLGALIACSIISNRIFAPAAALPSLMIQWSHAKASLRALDAIWNLEDDHSGQEHPINLKHVRGDYEFENVTMQYREKMALQVTNLSIRGGEKIAVLGPVGSGKTSLLRLLSGMYKPQDGRITLDGIDIAHINKPVLSENIGFVQQDGRLFYGTLRDNLVLGLIDPGDDMIMEAAHKIGLMTAVVTPHPKGFQQMINEGGTGLSGGQRQLVNLTRAYLRNPRIWLLDEPSASMDSGLEQQVITSIKEKLDSNATLILVTHKQNMLELVDRIIVINQNKVVLDGPKEEVIARLQGGAASSIAEAEGSA